MVIDYLEARDIPYVLDDSRRRRRLPEPLRDGPWTVYVAMLEADEQLMVHSTFNPPVPAEARAEIALLLTRVNFGIVHGNFELDLDDGELRYKTSIDVRGDRLTEALFENVVAANVSMFDRYVPAIEAVVRGEDPAVAVAAIESDE